MKKHSVSFFGHNLNEMIYLCLLSTPPFHFIVCERRELSGFRQWAWVMVSKRRQAPVNVRTSCLSANEHSKARLSVVQLWQSVLLPYQCRNWTATWSVAIVLLSYMSATERVLAYDSRDTMKVKEEPPHFMAFFCGSQVGGVTTVF